MAEKNYRATVVRRDGRDEDWGFFDMVVLASGALAVRANEATPFGGYDHFIAPGEWLEVRDVHSEDDE